MDWAAMVMNMYMMWAQRRGFAVTVVEEMPGEIAGIKVHFLCLIISASFCVYCCLSIACPTPQKHQEFSCARLSIMKHLKHQRTLI